MSDIHHSLTRIACELQARGWMLVTAESCTGGLVAAACTDLPGSSAWFDRGYVTYSNTAKTQLLAVPPGLIEAHGAVSEPVAIAMAQGAAHQPHTVSVATTGVAGPGGGSPDKPVGTVWFAWHINGHTWAQQRHFAGDRAAIRTASVRHALSVLAHHLAPA